MKLFLLVVILATSVSSKLIIINKEIDAALIRKNELARQNEENYYVTPDYEGNQNLSFSESLLLGLDSLVRTGNCLMDFQDNNTFVFDYYFGYSLWAQSFDIIKIYGQDMSAFLRIKDNSIHLKFTVHNDTQCRVSLGEIQFQKLSDVEFYASRPEYDGLNVNKFFQTDVLPGANRYLESKKDIIEKNLQKEACRYFRSEMDNMSQFHRVILEKLLKF